MCLGSFMAAEYDELPDAVRKEVQAFGDVNIAWLSKRLTAACVVSVQESERRARAIYAAVAGAQLLARSRSDISLVERAHRQLSRSGSPARLTAEIRSTQSFA